MFILRLWNYFCGYAIIIVKGIRIERFINLAVVNGIYLWDIEKIDYTTIKAKINIKDFFKLRSIVRKTDSNIQIIEKCGMPFKIKIMKRRKWFFLGLGALLVFIYILSSYIWMIEIEGLARIDEQAIIDNLSLEGLKVGAKKNKINKREIENRMLIRMPDLTWMGIQIKGTKAFITVVEKKPEPQLIDRDEPCDIIASKDGVIDKILVLNGDGMVKDGDTVKKGQILVSGTIIRDNISERYVHSMAEVHARTWYEDVEEIPYRQIKYKKTGRTFRTYSMEIINRKLERNKKIPFENYNKSSREIYLFNFGSYVFPIKLIITRYEELVSVTKIIDEEEAKAICEKRLNARIKLQIPENAIVLNNRIEYFTNDNSLIGKIYVEVMEDIGVKVKID
ncbi:sporulation protein YqfD [Lutispora thermophila]|uniref:Similar to stage IV sporulation protein n=1 Tax=Lutispora thermophila DSM 19022 TaxID=1122184 RepID=A0A1M6ESF5_9FIRM|nr:sporulation protein YqfD [Lutispora thermophila]SHI88434.1 similar to stage IV sporulation protein [Lutispora thermophila DSM 19022]